MPSLNGVDARLLEIVSAAKPSTIGDVVAAMQRIDEVLPGHDGLKWFNKMYMMVTQEIDAQAPASGWKDAAWLTRLDVVFAGFYFAAIASELGKSPDTASSWQALFESRNQQGIDRIQFALAGMNAHINHDLALALVATDEEMGLTPTLESPQHNDYEQVNSLLAKVLPMALNFLAADVAGELAQDTGKIGRLLAIWKVSVARDLAWDFADHLRSLGGVSRGTALEAQDKLSGVIGRSLLLPID